jgi:hypothetical protein
MQGTAGPRVSVRLKGDRQDSLFLMPDACSRRA